MGGILRRESTKYLSTDQPPPKDQEDPAFYTHKDPLLNLTQHIKSHPGKEVREGGSREGILPSQYSLNKKIFQFYGPRQEFGEGQTLFLLYGLGTML